MGNQCDANSPRQRRKVGMSGTRKGGYEEAQSVRL